MAKKGKNITINEGLPGWVMTYGDMMSLLLCFFVLIVSFSTMQEVKFQQAIQSIRASDARGRNSASPLPSGTMFGSERVQSSTRE